MCDFSVEAVNNNQEEEKKNAWSNKQIVGVCVWLITLSVCLMNNYKYDSLIDTNHKICRRANWNNGNIQWEVSCALMVSDCDNRRRKMCGHGFDCIQLFLLVFFTCHELQPTHILTHFDCFFSYSELQLHRNLYFEIK